MEERKKERFKKKMREYLKDDVCIAFSGGVDSSLLLSAACEAAGYTGKKVYAVTMDTVLHPSADMEIAKSVLEKTKAEHSIIQIDELSDPNIQNNPQNRCYLCKKALYSHVVSFAEEKNIPVLMEGTNADDLHLYRPGLKAVRELNIQTPLADCGITKKEVRELAKEYQIPVADRPAAPCLATRLPYGEKIDLELLERIDEGEKFLKELGLGDVRIRVHRNILRLEINPEGFPIILQNRKEILENLKKTGCVYITLDLEGFRSGSMDL